MTASRVLSRRGQDFGMSKGEEGGAEKQKKKARPTHYNSWLDEMRIP